jgi:hypothetical protein
MSRPFHIKDLANASGLMKEYILTVNHNLKKLENKFGKQAEYSFMEER